MSEKKPGYRTTEFWFALLCMVVGTLLASGVVADGGNVAKVAGVILDGLAMLGYTYSRTSVKKAELTSDTALIDTLK